MQVANDAASPANELPSREARPGRRVNQGGELREDCAKGALSVVLLAESAAFVAHKASASRRPWCAATAAPSARPGTRRLAHALGGNGCRLLAACLVQKALYVIGPTDNLRRRLRLRAAERKAAPSERRRPCCAAGP